MKFCILHEKDLQWVKRVELYTQGGIAKIGLELTPNKNEALKIEQKKYEPNETRLVELLQSLTDSTYKVEVVS